MIEYEWIKEGLIAVFLDGKRVGKIIKTLGGYQYRPKGSNISGRIYPTIQQCKDSLEHESKAEGGK